MIDAGDTAWLITATALVLFMTLPGLALFYGGLVRAENLLSVLMREPSALGELPAMLEARDLYAAPSGHGEIGPERAVGRVVNVESHADSGLDVLRAALASTKHRTEGRPGPEPP